MSMTDDKPNDFVSLMLKKSKKKEDAEAQTRTGTKEGIDRSEVEANLKAIQEKLQKSK